MSNEVSNLSARLRRFRTAYGEHRASEGRGIEKVSELLTLPYLATGPFAKQWGVRARTFDRFVRTILKERAKEVASRPVTILDLGAGSGWLCYRVVRAGHRAIAMDIRTDAIDGLAAGKAYHSRLPRRFSRVAASFDGIPLAAASVDIAVFNASLHYTLNLVAVIREACRVVTSGGRIAILDSPFYANASAGEAMIDEKRRTGAMTFGDRADDLLGLPFLEYLTPERLHNAVVGLSWHRHRVRYPLWYELRPLVARLERRRPPSRFDLWEARVP